MRLVLDTNVVASGLLWDGPPAQLLDAAQAGEVELITSLSLLAELAGILTREKFANALAATGFSPEELVLGYAALATLVTPATIPPTVSADPTDDHVLSCALAGQVALIVTGDKHLHGLGGQYQGIRIVKPAEVLSLMAGE